MGLGRTQVLHAATASFTSAELLRSIARQPGPQ